MAYKLISTKGTREVEGTQADAIAAAIAMEADLQPAYGVTVEIDGDTVAEIRDGVDVYADEVTLQGPVTTDGWYPTTDGRVAEVIWGGNPHRPQVGRVEAEIPSAADEVARDRRQAEEYEAWKASRAG